MEGKKGERKKIFFKNLVLTTFVCLGEELARLTQCSLYRSTAFDSPESKAERQMSIGLPDLGYGDKRLPGACPCCISK